MPPKNSVVNDLIRAAAGASARNVSDEDVDKYVADLILKEAEEKRKKYDQVGVQAYKPNTSKPKPNTRFLLNMVKATDSHNQAVIKANEKNVAKLRQERLERERKQEDESRRKKDNERHSHRHHHHNSKKQKQRTAAEEVQFKGRGKVKINSSMDRYFSEGYDPLLDVESEKEDDYVFAVDDDKKTKKKKKKSKRSRSSSSSDSSNEIGPKPPPIRAWDAGKT
ncbi:hypothetical protein BD408DRAFT_344977 [Parasitella parasitica]|nr:hypothetical protein BD408DRAFT_344977 [Parasitella parasitica]